MLHLPFVRHLGIQIASVKPGLVSVEMPYDARPSTPPGLFPARVVGAVGNVAAIASGAPALRPGPDSATPDFTIKTTGIALGKTGGRRPVAAKWPDNVGRDGRHPCGFRGNAGLVRYPNCNKSQF